MSESLLKKAWEEQDIRRVRNLIKGDYGAATRDQIGYSRKEEFHKEGDVWEENPEQWTIENGLKRSISKLQKARELIRIPLTCPKCGKALNTALDKKMYGIHGVCFDCTLKIEEDLRKAGLYEAYEKEIMSGNIQNFVQELRDRIQTMTGTKVEYSTDQGELEDWGEISTDLIKSLEQWAELLTEKLGND